MRDEGDVVRVSDLMQLKNYLDIYSSSLVDWRTSIEQAVREISQLSTDQAAELTDEIRQIDENKVELEYLERRVELGWALYRSILDDQEIVAPISLPLLN